MAKNPEQLQLNPVLEDSNLPRIEDVNRANQALVLERKDGNLSGQGETLNAMGDVYSDLGQDQKAHESYEQAAKFPPPSPRNPPKIVLPPELAASAPASQPVTQAAAPMEAAPVTPPVATEATAAEAPPTTAVEQLTAASEAPSAAAAEQPPVVKGVQGEIGGTSFDAPPTPPPTQAAAPPPAQDQAVNEPPAAASESAVSADAPAQRTLTEAEMKQLADQQAAAARAQAAEQERLEQEQARAEGESRREQIGSSRPIKGTVTSTGFGNGVAVSAPAKNLPVERYPNIEAPDMVTAGQEIAVQVSLTSEQISQETKIISGAQNQGKVQLQMAAGENQWRLTVNITAPGMEITRGGTNTSEITIARDSDSSIALFYLRAQPLDAANAEGKRETRILATLWHDSAFLARLSRPLTIVAGASVASTGNRSVAQTEANAQRPAARAMLAVAPIAKASSAAPAVRLDPTIVAPDLTIIENRIGNMLRLTFYSANTLPVEADVANADELHAWINSHFSQMASHGRAFAPESAGPAQAKAELSHATDYLNAFGAELYDRFAPQAFKDLFFQLWPVGSAGKFRSIQIFSDDPSLPWELMLPAAPDGKGRMDFLGATFSIARWPLSRRGSTRPPQSLAMEKSVVIAPGYRGAQQLTAANQELVTLKSMPGFTEVNGDYASVRDLAGDPPQGIVHFAGHGEVMDQNGVPQFAILLEDSEMDPATWQALGNDATATHPLFFFNACDVGESRQFMNDVDGWAPALLGNGASGYIGALWPVKDKTAELFATVFYEGLDKSLASGTTLNVASLLAVTRAQVFRDTGDATALAYVFYGDPRLVLTSAPARR